MLRSGLSSRPKDRPKQRSTRRRYAERRRLPFPILPVAALAIAVVGGFFLVRSLELGAPGERFAVSGVGDHRAEGTPIQYSTSPPVGGPHWPSVQPWGYSPQPVPDERAVHNLEHGGVVVSHNLIAQADLDRLRALLTTYPRDRYGQVKLLIRPYEAIPPGTFVLAAWGWKQTFTSYDEAKVRAFLDAHLDRCCENVP
jgi:hypothetical protein